MPRKPQDPALKILHGSPGHHPKPKKLRPGPPPGRPKMPSWLGKVAKAKWRALIPQLEELRILTALDGDVIAVYCVALEQIEETTKTLAKEGLTVTSARGVTRPHPCIRIQHSALAASAAFGKLLALSPAVRRGWFAKPSQDDEADDLALWLDGADTPA